MRRNGRKGRGIKGRAVSANMTSFIIVSTDAAEGDICITQSESARLGGQQIRVPGNRDQ